MLQTQITAIRKRIKVIKIFGLYLALDGLFSMILVKDKRPLWQLARQARMMIGIYLLLYG